MKLNRMNRSLCQKVLACTENGTGQLALTDPMMAL